MKSSHLRIVSDDISVVEGYLRNPWNPFVVSVLSVPEFSSELRFQPEWLIGLFILAMRDGHENGRERLPENIILGLRDLGEFHYDSSLNSLTQHSVALDELRVRTRGRSAAEDRLQRARGVDDERIRERRVHLAQASVARNGESRWQAYLAAIGAVRRFAAHAGVLSSSLPDNPTAGLHGSQQESEARRPLTESEMDQIWKAASRHRDPELSTLVLDFIRETAARRQSVIDLRLDDICWGGSAVWLNTKFGRTHRQVVSRDLMERIAIRKIRAGWNGVGGAQVGHSPLWKHDPDRSAFCRDNGAALTTRWFDSLFSLIDREVDFDEGFRFTSHYLRHTSVSQVDRIAGYAAARQFAGHRPGGRGVSRGDATSIYVRWPHKESKALFRAMFLNTPPGSVDTLELVEKYGWLTEQGLIT